MTRAITGFTVLFLALSACNRDGGEAEGRDPTISAAKPAEQDKIAADNSQINQRDREPTALTPGDQGETEADRAITQRIRQGLMRDSALSANAKNVKIITRNGVVTLRGPVKTASEKMEIARIAQGTEGAREVDNQLEASEDAPL